jgi:serine/threonine protein kinase
MLTGTPPFYSSNVQAMYDMIRLQELQFPPYISDVARAFLSALLERDPARRLGNRPGDEDVEAVKAHAFFAPIDWDDLYTRRVPPPWRPAVRGDRADTSNFDREFTNEPVGDSAHSAGYDGLEGSLPPRFEGFTYASAGALAASPSTSL